MAAKKPKRTHNVTAICEHCFARSKRGALFTGMARLGDLSGQITQRYLADWNPGTDSESIYGDWLTVGRHLQSAIEQHSEHCELSKVS